MKIRGFRESDRAAVIDLWRRNDLTRPWNDPHLDVDRKVAHDPDVHGSGLGRMLMDEIELRLVAMGCPKVNLLVRSSNAGVIEFHERLGYDPDETVSLGKRLIPDPGPERS